MGESRGRGRPRRQEGDTAGRSHLLEAARAWMRTRPRIDMPRKELATEAGVTPGLVTYYFPTEVALVEAAARPVIDQYLDRLAVVLSEDHDVEAAFRALILLLLEISRNDGQLLDTYINFVKDRQVAVSGGFLVSAYADLSRFLARCEARGLIRPVHSAFCQSFVWGVCRMVAQSQELSAMLAAEMKDGGDLAERQADLILGLLMHGLASAAPPGPADGAGSRQPDGTR